MLFEGKMSIISMMRQMNKLTQIYKVLFRSYGAQGWWPLSDINGTNPTKTGSLRGYHIGDYSYPKDKSQIFEICVGAIATQNTSWIQSEKVILGLRNNKSLSSKVVLEMSADNLKEIMKPAGYFNQKAKKIKIMAAFLETKNYKKPTREELLGLWGIGEETADSILLYAFAKLEFVVDTYTKRIFSRLGFFAEDAKYRDVKDLFENNLSKDIKIYQEYHALIVEHAKRFCLKTKPLCSDCLLSRYCSFTKKRY